MQPSPTHDQPRNHSRCRRDERIAPSYPGTPPRSREPPAGSAHKNPQYGGVAPPRVSDTLRATPSRHTTPLAHGIRQPSVSRDRRPQHWFTRITIVHLDGQGCHRSPKTTPHSRCRRVERPQADPAAKFGAVRCHNIDPDPSQNRADAPATPFGASQFMAASNPPLSLRPARRVLCHRSRG